MTHRRKRCDHCKVSYAYQSSGHGCHHPDNDDRYCPDCMHAINEVLKTIPVKKRDVWLPLSPKWFSGELKIQKAKEILKEQEKKNSKNPFFLLFHELTGYRNISWRRFEHLGVQFRLVTNKDTKEELLETRYEEDIETNEIGGTW